MVPREQTSGIGFSTALFLILLFALVLIVCLPRAESLLQEQGVDLSRSHGEARHGQDAQTARSCIERGWNVRELFNPATGMTIRWCEMLSGGYAWQIIDQEGFEVTVYKTLRSMLSSLFGRGFLPWP